MSAWGKSWGLAFGVAWGLVATPVPVPEQTAYYGGDHRSVHEKYEAIRKAHAAGIKIGICGQAPSNYRDFAEFLVREGIDSISLNPDSFVKTSSVIADAEAATSG